MLNADLASFTYSSQPHAAPTKVAAKQARYRDPDDTPLTLMSDPRVVRGSTHSLARKITLSKNELSRSQGLATRRGPPESEQKPQPSYNFTVKPFSTDEIDVSKYLIQQTESRPQKKPLETQTDEFIPRPDTPDYVPAKVGVDIGTQVEDVRDLFDFDTEVFPIVEVIVQKTLDQALFELSSEEELKNLEHAARDFRAEKFRGDDWMRTRENQAIRENKQRRERIQALQTARENEKRTKAIIAGVQMMRQTFPSALENAFAQLFKNGTWKETDNAIAEKDFIPAVLEKSNEMIAAHASASEILDDVLLGTEAYYQTFPSYAGPQERRRMVVVLTFRRAPAEGDAPAAEEGEGGESRATTQNKDVTVMTVQMSPKDSIDSLNRRIRNEVNRLKKLAEKRAGGGEEPPADGAAEDEAGAVPAAPAAPAEPVEDIPAFSSILPDNSALAPLRNVLYEGLARTLPADMLVSPTPSGPGNRALLRDIAFDASLWNFPFPETVEIEMLV